MAQLKMNHLAIRSPDANATRDFFMKTLGLTVGPRPDFPFPGYWLYKESHDSYLNALIHIVEIDPNNPQGLIEYLGGKDIDTLHGTGAIDHVAFFATELENMLKHLNEIGVTYRERLVPTIRLHQVFLEDPNGITIELNYPAEERVALDEKIKTHAH